MSKDTIIDVHEVMEHLRGIGGSASFTLNANGSGALDLAGALTMRWRIYPEFVLNFRKLRTQDAKDRVVEAAVATRERHGSRFCGCEFHKELDDAVDALESPGSRP